AGAKRKLVTMVVDVDGVDANADEPVFSDGTCVGYVTSGGYAHWTEQSMAMGYVPSELVQDGTRLEVEILGERYPAIVTAAPLYDPQGLRMRS
ncbi:MAG: glycine cleavage T C-terminal barrel domain-containing protein, partial [Dongiaceae bacterium]